MSHTNEAKEIIKKELLEQLGIFNCQFKINIVDIAKENHKSDSMRTYLRINIEFFIYGERKSISRYICDDEISYMKYTYKNERAFTIATEITREILNYIIDIKRGKMVDKNVWRSE